MDVDILSELMDGGQSTTMGGIAEYCRRAELGDAQEAATELALRVRDPATLRRLADYAGAAEDDVVSFYRLGVDVEIAGPWGAFVLAADDHSRPGDPARITPIGLFALAAALRDIAAGQGGASAGESGGAW